jgi:hypothetical protein
MGFRNRRDEQPDEPIEAHVDRVEAVSDAADVMSVVEDLLAVAPGEEEQPAEGEPPASRPG